MLKSVCDVSERKTGGFRSGRGLDPCDRGDETIARPGRRLDAAAPFSVLIEDAAQRRNLDGQVAFPDHHSGPDGLHNRLFRDQLPLPVNVVDEVGQGACR